MTARSKVTLVEAQHIRSYLINTATVDGIYLEQVTDAVDVLLAIGVIDTDAALRLIAEERP